MTEAQSVALHIRDCSCIDCKPSNKMASSNFQVIFLSEYDWENYGHPANIEEYFQNISEIECDNYEYEEYLRNKNAQ